MRLLVSAVLKSEHRGDALGSANVVSVLHFFDPADDKEICRGVLDWVKNTVEETNEKYPENAPWQQISISCTKL